MTSALASLTATYTDSEGEEDNDEQTENHVGQDASNESPINSIPDNKSNASSQPASPVPVKVTSRLAKLVSYHDDTFVSDEDGDTDVPHEVIIMGENEPIIEQCQIDEDGMIPPEPPGHCSTELQEKIARHYEKMVTQQIDMNAVIQNKKDFRNPSIYEKLIQFCDLNEFGTNYPPALYDPLKWSKESYYEELAKVQKAEMDRREKERRGKVEFVSGTKKSDDDKKRRSKWDQPGGGGVATQNIKPAGLVKPSLTTSSSGTKGTVISAFGSLPKRPRP